MIEAHAAPVLSAAFISSGTSTLGIIFLAIASFIIGILGGMMGAPLGVVRLPLMLTMGLSPLVAAGTNLGISILVSVAGAWPHYKAKRVVTRVVIVFGLPAIVGAFVGGVFANKVPAWTLLALVGAILAWSAFGTLKRAIRPRTNAASPGGAELEAVRVDSSPELAANWKRHLGDGGVGLAIGVVGGAAGLVLGVLRLPILVNVLKMEQRQAVGTNNTISILAAVFGFAGHALNGEFNMTVMLVMGITAIVGSVIGAMRVGVANDRQLRLITGLVLLVVTPIILYRAAVAFPG